MGHIRSIGKRALPVCVTIIRIGLGLMFLCAALPKIRQPYDFLASVYNYQLVGPTLGLVAAMMLPWIEVIIGICLLGGVLVPGALAISIALGAVFLIVTSSALYRDLSISCGCFTISGNDTINYLIPLRAIAITLAGVAAYIGTIFLQSKKGNALD